MTRLDFINEKQEKTAIGLMSGTSVDGIDAALLTITGCGIETRITERAFLTVPYLQEVRQRLLALASGSFGGSKNPVILDDLRQLLPACSVMTNEDIGKNSDSKEACAFAVLANEALCGNPNNVPSATGAKKFVVMGKISVQGKKEHLKTKGTSKTSVFDVPLN